MNHWNYRVMLVDGEYGIHEVYYNETGPVAHTNAVYPYGETLEEIKFDVERMLDACKRPIVTYNETLGYSETHSL